MRNQANDSFCDAMTTIRDARSIRFQSSLRLLVDCAKKRRFRKSKRANAQMNVGARVRQNEMAVLVSVSGECSKMNRCLIVRHVFNIVLLLLLLRYYVHRLLPHSSLRVLHVLQQHTSTHTHTVRTDVPKKTTSIFLTRANTPSFTTHEKEETKKTQDQRMPNRTQPKTSIRRRRQLDEWEKKDPSHMLFIALVFGCVAFAEVDQHAMATSHRSTAHKNPTEKKDPNQTNLFNTILMNLNGSPRQFR